MFAARDGLLAVKHFVRPLPGASYAIMLLYWAAQACIAVSAREALSGGVRPALSASLP
jgi:alkenylglycerophosphocholine/alkenylglycerophosphoethanolamine hydrolase